MKILIIGLALFLGIHLIPAVPGLKAPLVNALAPNRYKAIFSMLSVLGLALIAFGYASAPHGPTLFNPIPAASAIAPTAMVISFILLAAANMKTRIRAVIKHPMLLGIGIWSLVHLLANGHAKAVVLFGAFLIFVLIDLTSVLLRNRALAFQPKPGHDVIAIASGFLLALAVMSFHRVLFGPTVVRWGF